MKEEGETYLGDGLYASHDGYHIKLRAPHIEGDMFVYLDPDVYLAFTAYVQSLVPPPPEAA